MPEKTGSYLMIGGAASLTKFSNPPVPRFPIQFCELFTLIKA